MFLHRFVLIYTCNTKKAGNVATRITSAVSSKTTIFAISFTILLQRLLHVVVITSSITDTIMTVMTKRVQFSSVLYIL